MLDVASSACSQRPSGPAREKKHEHKTGAESRSDIKTSVGRCRLAVSNPR
jgi:hypothetical protein